jgi:cytochrome c biogenesis protein CcdA
MIDPTSSAFSALSGGAADAPLLIALAGVASGFGPCAGVRSAVLMSIVSAAERSRGLFVAAFLLGVVLAYGLLALVLPLFAELLANSTIVYVALAGALLISGVRSICRSSHRCTPHVAPARQSLGAAFGAGLASSAILSPCCAPLVLGILSVAAQNGRPQQAALFLGLFALGHAMPTVVMTLTLAAPLGRFYAWARSDSAAIVSGALQIGVGAFYAVLA